MMVIVMTMMTMMMICPVLLVNRYCVIRAASYQRNCAGFIVPGHPIQSYPTTEMTIDQILTVH